MLRRDPTTTTNCALLNSLHNQINTLEIANPSSANVSGVMSKNMFYLSVAPLDNNILVSLHLLWMVKIWSNYKELLLESMDPFSLTKYIL